MKIEIDKFYTIKEAAEILSLAPVTLTRKCKSGFIKCNNISTGKNGSYRIEGRVLLDILGISVNDIN